MLFHAKITLKELLLEKIRNLKDQAFGFIPAKAGICDGFSITAAVDILSTVFYIAFDHESFDNIADTIAVPAVLKDFLEDSGLLKRIFSGVFMICIDDDRGVFEFRSGFVGITETHNIFVVIVGVMLSLAVCVAA